MEFDLWPHQERAIVSVHKAIGKGIGRGLWVMPTGTGKTVAFAALAKSLDVPTLVVVHRDELLKQAEATFREVWPEATVGTLPGEGWQASKVVVASVQSLASRLNKIDPARFGLVVADEAHHAPARNWGKVLGYFQPRFLLGVTASPERLDGKPLHPVFGGVVYRYSLGDAVRDGRIVPMRQRSLRTGVRLRVEAGQDGRCPERCLAQAAATQARAEAVAEGYLTHGEGRQALFFAGDLEAVGQIRAALATRGVGAAAVTGAMKLQERQAILQGFRQGHLQALVSCEVLTEGFDERSIGCVVMARPTQSLGLYMQCVGRGLRLGGEGKKDCLVLDVIDLPSGVRTFTAADLFGARLQDCGGRLVEEAAAEERERYCLEPLVPTAPQEWRWHDGDDTRWAELPSLAGCRVPSRRWPATARQLKALKSYGLEPARAITEDEAGHLLAQCEALDRRYFTPATPGQVRTLKNLGEDARGLTKRQAGKRIAARMYAR